jgi:hypothetical protein
MKLRISIICVVAVVLVLNLGCSALRGDEKSRMRNTNRQAYQQTDPNLAPVAEAPNTGMSWGGSLSPR